MHDDGKQATSTRSQFQTPYQLLLTFLTEAQGVLNFRLVNKCQALLLICYVFNELKKFKQRTDQLEMLIQSNRSLSQQRELASQASTSIKVKKKRKEKKNSKKSLKHIENCSNHFGSYKLSCNFRSNQGHLK